MALNVEGTTGGTPLPLGAGARNAGWLRQELGRGEALYRVGDVAGSVYRVDEGLLKLTIMAPLGKERIVALAGPGDVVGALGPCGARFQETAEALSEQTAVHSKPHSSLLAESAEELLAAAAQQSARLQQALEDADLPVPVRLARVLLRLGRRFGQRTENGDVWLSLPLTHEHFAGMIGAARETTSSALGEIRSAGLLTGTRGRYRFRPEDLERRALLLGVPGTVPVGVPTGVPAAVPASGVLEERQHI